jgi:glucose-6-phosphate 1-dehydrogenase
VDPSRDVSLLILGASGDLTTRLLLPGVGALVAQGRAGQLHLHGVGNVDLSTEEWRDKVAASFAKVGAEDQQEVKDLLASTQYRTADVTRAEDLTSVLADLQGQVAIFFALPPAITMSACAALQHVQLPADLRLVVEKPFGTDEVSARSFNAMLTSLVPEDHIHRVDHFLGKSTVLNLLGLRFGNRTIEPLLSADDVERIDIVFDETLGLEDRAGYYDRAGALVDMIQSHLLQVLALLTMDAPPALTAVDIRERKAAILRCTRIWKDDPVGTSRRARYTAGNLNGRDLPAYVDEQGVNPANNTETFAEMTVEVANWRWAGVPIVLRSAKAIGRPRKEAVVTFKPPKLLPEGFSTDADDRDRLFIGFDETEQLRLDLTINGPSDPYELDRASMLATFGPGELPAYGEVLAGVLTGDPMLSVRGDSAEQCWRIVQPVIDAWRSGAVPMGEYPAGSSGPDTALIHEDMPAMHETEDPDQHESEDAGKHQGDDPALR